MFHRNETPHLYPKIVRECIILISVKYPKWLIHKGTGQIKTLKVNLDWVVPYYIIRSVGPKQCLGTTKCDVTCVTSQLDSVEDIFIFIKSQHVTVITPLLLIGKHIQNTPVFWNTFKENLRRYFQTSTTCKGTNIVLYQQTGKFGEFLNHKKKGNFYSVGLFESFKYQHW